MLALRHSAIFVGLVLAVGCGDETGGTDGGGADTGGSDCTMSSDGTGCAAGGSICLGGLCVVSQCGDGFVNTGAGEQCDDGNTTAFDGCEPTCNPTCNEDSTCDDGVECNGMERCVPSAGCMTGTALDDGAECALGGVATGVCRSGGCVVPGCGDGLVSGAESCDDGNTTGGDGCERDCRFTCEVDPSMPNTWHQDCDDDGFAASGSANMETCLEPAPSACGGGWTLETPVDGASDCDDTDAAINPDADEVCNGEDDDCDGTADNVAAGVATTWFRDTDGDTFGNDASTIEQCMMPAGYVDRGGDCDDGDSGAFPGQTMYFTRARNSGGFDFNCDGSSTRRYTGINSSGCFCSPCPVGFCCSGECAGWVTTQPNCGGSGTWRECDCDGDLVNASRDQECR